MRIIAGKFRGRRLVAPPGRTTRPTTDRVRESLFSILGDLTGCYVWDAFAGSGALGFESLSRGAARVLFTDTDRHALQAIRRNIDLLGLTVGEDFVVRRLSFFAQLSSLDTSPDIIFCDPPYSAGLYDEILAAVAASPAILPGTDLVLEMSAHDTILPPDTYHSLDERRYGSTKLLFLTKGPSDTP